MNDDPIAASPMTFWDHLQELRVRLVRILIAVVIAFAATYAFRFKL